MKPLLWAAAAAGGATAVAEVEAATGAEATAAAITEPARTPAGDHPLL
jgi:hypothetical protein